MVTGKMMVPSQKVPLIFPVIMTSMLLRKPALFSNDLRTINAQFQAHCNEFDKCVHFLCNHHPSQNIEYFCHYRHFLPEPFYTIPTSPTDRIFITVH